MKTRASLSSGARRLHTAFLAEMTLSPVLAGIAFLVPEIERWGAFGYVPATFWLALFVECLFTFRWRGLWFLLGPPIALVAIMAFLVAAPPMQRLVATAPLLIRQ